MLPALLFVALLESIVIYRILNISFKRSFECCCRANIRSTFIGMPLGYFVSLGFFLLANVLLKDIAPKIDLYNTNTLDVFTMHALMSGKMQYYDYHLYILSTMFMLIPYYYASVYIEKTSLQRNLPDIDKKTVFHAAITMNRWSYLLIGVLLLILYFIT